MASTTPPETPTLDVPRDVVEALRKSEERAIEAMHGFANVINEQIPPLLPTAEGAARPDRQQVIDATFELIEQLLEAQTEFVRRVIDSATEALAAKSETPADSQKQA